MALEYVIVNYWRRRRVYMDSGPYGYTNESLRVEAGTRTFDLGTPVNYDPPSQTGTVSGTSLFEPMEITFRAKAQTAPPGS